MRQPITFVVDDERDADILAWLDGQTNKSGAIREAIRTQIRMGQGGQDEIIRLAVSQGLAQLPDVVAAAVQSALSNYQFTPATAPVGDEDPELAASLDEQLDGFL